jgi:predicted ribosome quality control (RQC) complex YloA/Tae2 family protein
MPLIPIPLSPEKTVEENVASYFKKAQKMQRSRQHLQERLEETEETLLQQEEEYEQLQNDPQSVILPLIETSATGVPTPPRKKIQTESKPYREFLSHDKLRLLVGKSSSDNDTLTLRIAKGNDLFLHVQGFPGSHVIIPTPKGKSVPLDTLLEGALLAKYFSKARSHQKSNIQYCQKKYIRKAKGAKPGQVLLQQAKTLYIENDEPRLKKVLNSVVEKEDPS